MSDEKEEPTPGANKSKLGEKSNHQRTRGGGSSTAGGTSASGGEGGYGGNSTTTSDDEEQQVPRHSRTGESDGERNKRRRTAAASPDDNNSSGSGGGKNMVSLDVMMEKMSATMSATMSSVVASAINSSGAVYNKEREDARGSVLAEQQRRERVECQLREAETKMAQRLIDERRIIEEESAVKYRELEAKFLETSLLKVVIFFISF